VVVALTTFQVAPGFAQDEPTRGDLPPTGVDSTLRVGRDLTSMEAEALARKVHALLAERLGSDQITEAELWMGAVQGMLDVVNRQQSTGVSRTQAALPPSGMLLTEEDAKRLGDTLKGELTGVGIEFKFYPRPGVLVVTRVLPESPAEAAGLLAGDRIVALDGVGLAGTSLQKVLDMLRGEEGTRIAVQYQRGDGLAAAAFAVGVQRASFHIQTVTDELRGGGVGYIRVFGFHRGTPAEVAESIDRLRTLGADRLVLDLRNNVGGDLVGAMGVADLFVEPGTVLCRIVEPGVGEQDLVAQQPQMTEQNLVILVNAWTHGAAEAVAAALQDHHRAYIIGQPTMGSAHTETLIGVGSSLVLRLASVRLLTPTGHSWQGRGVIPDTPFGSIGDGSEAGSSLDPVFDMAVYYLESEGL
jgi:carboxyl-terminal processing protease